MNIIILHHFTQDIIFAVISDPGRGQSRNHQSFIVRAVLLKIEDSDYYKHLVLAELVKM